MNSTPSLSCLKMLHDNNFNFNGFHYVSLKILSGLFLQHLIQHFWGLFSFFLSIWKLNSTVVRIKVFFYIFLFNILLPLSQSISHSFFLFFYWNQMKCEAWNNNKYRTFILKLKRCFNMCCLKYLMQKIKS